MPIYIGDKEIATVFKGDTELDNIQLGDQQQWIGIIVTPDPSINIVSDTTTSITFDLVNNHEETVTIFYEINDTTPDQYSVSVAANSSSRKTISGLSPNTTYTIYAYALEADQLPSNVIAKVETTDKLTTATPTFTNVSPADTSVTFTLRNNDSSTVTMYYEVNDSTPDITATVSAGASITRTLSGLSPGQNYTLYARAIASNKNMSSTRSSGFSTVNFGPGNTSLVAGNANTGYFGEVPITDIGSSSLYSDIASNFSFGGIINSSTPLLKFIHSGKVKYITKENVLNSSAVATIHTKIDAAAGSIMNIGGRNYKVRLVRSYAKPTDLAGNPKSHDSGGDVYVLPSIRNLLEPYGRYNHNNSTVPPGYNWPNDNSPWNENSPNEWATLMFPVVQGSSSSYSKQTKTTGVPTWDDLRLSFSGTNRWCVVAERRLEGGSSSNNPYVTTAGINGYGGFNMFSANTWNGGRLLLELV